MFNVGFDDKSLTEITNKLKALDNKALTQETRKALRKGANAFKREIVKNAKSLDNSRTTNAIWRNVAIRSKKQTKKSSIGVYVGILGGAREGKNKGIGKGGDTWYWRLLEFGTVNMKARPFFRPAIDNPATQQKALDDTLKFLQKKYLNAK